MVQKTKINFTADLLQEFLRFFLIGLCFIGGCKTLRQEVTKPFLSGLLISLCTWIAVVLFINRIETRYLMTFLPFYYILLAIGIKNIYEKTLFIYSKQ